MLPSLKEVEIDDCPGMETFSLGLLSTPNLFKLKINKKLVDVKGLNDGIRDHFMTKNQSQEGDMDMDMEFSSEDSEHSCSQSKEGAEDLEFSSDDPEYSSMDEET